MDEANATRLCLHCGAVIEPKLTKTGKVSERKRLYCSRRCLEAKKSTRPRKRGKRSKGALMLIACHGCGLVVSRLVRHDEVGRYCSRKCNTESMKRVADEKAALRRIAYQDCAHVTKRLAERATQDRIAKEVDALHRIASYVEIPATFMAKCRGCGDGFIARRNGGLHRIKCDACLLKSKAKHRRVDKARRRARERGVEADKIDPIKVFERDKWRCHMCGCKTVKALRGTYEPMAPEVDHIRTLADGGTHTWGNVACACRRCNLAKGGESRGQLGLNFAA